MSPFMSKILFDIMTIIGIFGERKLLAEFCKANMCENFENFVESGRN